MASASGMTPENEHSLGQPADTATVKHSDEHKTQPHAIVLNMTDDFTKQSAPPQVAGANGIAPRKTSFDLPPELRDMVYRDTFPPSQTISPYSMAAGMIPKVSPEADIDAMRTYSNLLLTHSIISRDIRNLLTAEIFYRFNWAVDDRLCVTKVRDPSRFDALRMRNMILECIHL
jgi:hypothetical protein